MGNNASIGRLAGEAARAVRNHAFEKTNHGIFLPKAKVHIGGVLRQCRFQGGAGLAALLHQAQVAQYQRLAVDVALHAPARQGGEVLYGIG